MKQEAFEQRGAQTKKLKVLEEELDTLDERYAFGKFDDEAQYNRLREKKQAEIDQIREQLLDSDSEISNLELYIRRAIEISQNIHNYWQLGSLEDKRKIQKLVFPKGIVVDTTNRTYLTLKVNSLFLAKSQFQRVSGGTNKKLPTKNGEESYLVAGAGFLVRPWRTRGPELGVLYYQKPVTRYRSSRHFHPHGLHEQAPDARA